ELPLPQVLPTIEGNVDYRQLRDQLLRIDSLLLTSGLETRLLGNDLRVGSPNEKRLVPGPNRTDSFIAGAPCAATWLACSFRRTIAGLPPAWPIALCSNISAASAKCSASPCLVRAHSNVTTSGGLKVTSSKRFINCWVWARRWRSNWPCPRRWICKAPFWTRPV